MSRFALAVVDERPEQHRRVSCGATSDEYAATGPDCAGIRTRARAMEMEEMYYEKPTTLVCTH
jgi:hypothetical protein